MKVLLANNRDSADSEVETLRVLSLNCPVQVDGETRFSRFIPFRCVSNLYTT